MNDDFVRKDVHDAQIDTLIVAINDTNSRIDDLKDRINDLHNQIVMSWTILGVLGTIGALVFAGIQWYLSVPH